MEIISLINLVLNGLLLGGLFALMAFGLSIMVGVMKVVNIAHGDIMILAAYIAFGMMSLLKIDPFLSIILVAPLMYVIGYMLQKFTINRVLLYGSDQPVLLTFALSIIIQNLLLLSFTADARSLIQPYLFININLVGLQPSPRYLISSVAAVMIFIAVYLFFKKTYLGKAMRAVPFDYEGAKLIGIRPDSVYNHAAGLSALISAVAGIMIGMSFTFYPDSGPMFILLSFGVIVVGGLGSLRGTMIGGLIVGEALVLGGFFLGSRFQLMAVYLIILVILYLKPKGLFGGRD
ncbi:MAG: branched-chain amino acid ABC transporter permease [Candidatus Caldarchaeum sp.]|nr:branched-chain amino acid ABC transporter permease [Candidatus Caldarchaeum sp.]MDW7977904.1 branched-chain amino acid ABC transporter permease [Candidatus Caldarchaeum sp.]